MIRRLVLFIIALVSLFPSLAPAYDVLVLQSRRDSAYDEVLKGFRFEQKSSLRMLVLSDYAKIDVNRIVREDRPRIILAIGDAALSATRSILKTPVVAVMSLALHTQKTSQTNLGGVVMLAPPEQYINIFRKMKSRRVGVIYSSTKSDWYLAQARHVAEAAGIELVTREVSSPRETLPQLLSIAGRIDALWMLPDSISVARETTEAYFKFGQQYAVPVISFAATYLGIGAAAVVEIDRIALGRQADAMSAALLENDSIGNVSLEFPKGITVKTNPIVLKHLGSSFDRQERNSRH